MNLSFEKFVENQIGKSKHKIEEIKIGIDHCVRRKQYWKHGTKPINKYFVKRYSERIQKLCVLVYEYESMIKYFQDAINGNCGRKVKAIAENYNSHYLKNEALEHDFIERIKALEQEIVEFSEVYVDPERIRKQEI